MPIFDRAPLVRRSALPVPAGQIRCGAPWIAETLGRLPDPIPACCLEGAVRLASLAPDAPEAARVREALSAALKAQAPDGGFPGSAEDALCAARAAWHGFLWLGDRAMLTAVADFLGWAAAHYDEWIGRSGLRMRPADLIGLALDFYRQTGAQGCLRLLARLRRDAVDWSSRLRTFSLTRSAEREADGADEATRAYLNEQADPVLLADGMRGVLCMSEYSGNQTEAETGAMAWPKIKRWHGAVCGGTSASPLLDGLSPSAVIDPASVGAWAETMAAYAAAGEEWAAEEAERLLHNALPVALRGKPFAVNQLPGDLRAGELTPDHEALGRLMRGAAALLGAAVLQTREGLRVLYAPEHAAAIGLYADGKRVRMTLGGGPVRRAIRLQPEEKASFAVELRVPGWAEGAAAAVCGEKTPCEAGKTLAIRREWSPDDTLVLDSDPALKLCPAWHSGLYAARGPLVLGLADPDPEKWALGLAEDGAADGALRAAGVKGWKLRGGQPDGVPVLPERTDGEETFEPAPFAAMRTRITVFPRVKA